MAKVTPTKFLYWFLTFRDHPLYKNQAAKFPAILDSFLNSASGEFKHGWVVGAGGRQDVGLRERCRDVLGQDMGHTNV